MRAIALLPMLCVIGSLVLTILCILAGYQSTFLENFELITFNTSQLGSTLVNRTAAAVSSSVPSNLPTSTSIPASVATALPSGLPTQIASLNATEIAEEIAADLNIHDFYKIHILDYCEGYYEPGPVPNASFSASQIWQNLTNCSQASAFSFFNATQVLQNELNPNVSLGEIQWPTQIQDAIDAMAVTQKVMFVLYCIGAAFAGLAALEAVIAFLVDGRLSAICNAVLDIIAFIALGIASGCATGFITVVSNAVNQYGASVNIQAYKGQNFLVITWIATVLPLIAAVLWLVDCCVGPDRRHRNKY